MSIFGLFGSDILAENTEYGAKVVHGLMEGRVSKRAVLSERHI